VSTITKTALPVDLDTRVFLRILEEGYGPGAWHGADLNAALSDVSPALAFWRPGPERHNIAEIALHHAYCIRAVRAQLSKAAPEAFVLQGEDWFKVSDQTEMPWPVIKSAVETQQNRLTAVLQDGALSALTTAERFDLVLGITCHAVYHAGQIQLIKRLAQ
jgi:hypothetical protein